MEEKTHDSANLKPDGHLTMASLYINRLNAAAPTSMDRVRTVDGVARVSWFNVHVWLVEYLSKSVS